MKASTLLSKWAVLLMLTAVLSACSANELNGNNEEKDFTEFSLYGTGCWWTTVSDEVIIINSNEELRRHIECDENANFPVIDFSRYTLLHVSGFVPHIFGVSNVHFEQRSSNSYKLNIEVDRSGPAPAMPWRWRVTILVEKIDDNSDIKLNVKYIY